MHTPHSSISDVNSSGFYTLSWCYKWQVPNIMVSLATNGES